MRCNACTNLNPHDADRCLRCGASLHASTPQQGDATLLEPGQTIDNRFEIVGLIGAGGMGTVYEARHRRLRRNVALKILNGELLGHSAARERMEQEAVALATIRHPNVVEIHDVLDWQGMLVLDLEFVSGGTLAGWIRQQGKLSKDDALRTMDSILAGLEAIHAAKLVHRDLQPANILLTDTKEPKIADLGVAHDLEGRGRTKTGARIGTPEYMSPEQIRGQPVGYATDVYACGLILYEMLTGAPPFDATSEFDLMKAHVETEPDLSSIQRETPQVASVLRTALAKDPSARWASAAAFRGALRGSGTAVEPESAEVTSRPQAGGLTFQAQAQAQAQARAVAPDVHPTEPKDSNRVSGERNKYTRRTNGGVPVERESDRFEPWQLGVYILAILVIFSALALR